MVYSFIILILSVSLVINFLIYDIPIDLLHITKANSTPDSVTSQNYNHVKYVVDAIEQYKKCLRNFPNNTTSISNNNQLSSHDINNICTAKCFTSILHNLMHSVNLDMVCNKGDPVQY
jgi:hypothetical protein